VAEAFGKVVELKTDMAQRVEGYKATHLCDSQAKAIIFDAIRTGVVGKTHCLDVYKEWSEPTHEEFAPRNVWSLFNAVTEVLKGRMAPDAIATRTTKLHLLADKACEIQPLTLAS
jgi:hypothetical protein